jgi:hypothetical protein
MKAKKSLESRIRGWFPQEPKVPNVAFTTNTMVNRNKFTLKNKTGKLGWILFSLSLFFLFLAESYSLLMHDDYTALSSDTRFLGIVFVFVFLFYQYLWQKSMKKAHPEQQHLP